MNVVMDLAARAVSFITLVQETMHNDIIFSATPDRDLDTIELLRTDAVEKCITQPIPSDTTFDNWFFLIADSATERNKLTMNYQPDKLKHFKVEDYKNKMAVSLDAYSKKGVFNVLTGFEMVGENNYGINSQYDFKFNSEGKLLTRHSRFDLTCKF